MAQPGQAAQHRQQRGEVPADQPFRRRGEFVPGLLVVLAGLAAHLVGIRPGIPARLADLRMQLPDTIVQTPLQQVQCPDGLFLHGFDFGEARFHDGMLFPSPRIVNRRTVAAAPTRAARQSPTACCG